MQPVFGWVNQMRGYHNHKNVVEGHLTNYFGYT